MLVSRSLLALALMAATTVMISAEEAAAAPCLVGDPSCAVGVTFYVCVTEPCDAVQVCVAFGYSCTKL